MSHYPSWFAWKERSREAGYFGQNSTTSHLDVLGSSSVCPGGKDSNQSSNRIHGEVMAKNRTTTTGEGVGPCRPLDPRIRNQGSNSFLEFTRSPEQERRQTTVLWGKLNRSNCSKRIRRHIRWPTLIAFVVLFWLKCSWLVLSTKLTSFDDFDISIDNDDEKNDNDEHVDVTGSSRDVLERKIQEEPVDRAILLSLDEPAVGELDSRTVRDHRRQTKRPKPSLSRGSTTPTIDSSSLIVCNVVDGSVYVLDALSGDLTNVFTTGRPLVGASHPMRVFPDLEGKLYLRDEIMSNNDEDDEEEIVRVMPMTVHDVLVHPVRTCLTDPFLMDLDEKSSSSSGADDCGIVAATKVTTLFGLDTTDGELLWTSHHGRSSTGNRNRQQQREEMEGDLYHQVVLQREDYMVHQVSTRTGLELWNVTLGHFSALDFDEAPIAGILDGGMGLQEDSRSTMIVEEAAAASSSVNEMPSIFFSHDGTSIMAVHQGRILWRRQLHSVISTVYGIKERRWIQVQVLDDLNMLDDDETATEMKPLPMLPSAASSHVETQEEHDLFIDILLKQIQGQQQQEQKLAFPGSGLVVYQPNAVDGRCTDSSDSQLEMRKKRLLEIEAPSLLELEGVPPLPGTTSYDFRYNGRTPPWQVQPEGILLTWDMVAATIMAALGTLFLAYQFYQHKKRKWIATPSTITASPGEKDIVPLTLESPMALHSSIHTRSMNAANPDQQLQQLQHSNPFVKRSQSLPVMHGEIRQPSASNETDTTPRVSMKSKEVTSNAQTPTAPTTKEASSTTPYRDEMPSNIAGIPLVRYSRYRAEFKELNHLGKGGFGSVVECQNVLDGRHYAMKKILIKTFAEDPTATKEQLERVLREVKILALLDHPNIVRYYTAWLELEEENDMSNLSTMDESYFDSYFGATESKRMTKCYSSEYLLNGIEDYDETSFARERPSNMGRPKARSVNPLGWNNMQDDFSLTSLHRYRNEPESSSRLHRAGSQHSGNSSPLRSMANTLRNLDNIKSEDDDSSVETRSSSYHFSDNETMTRDTPRGSPSTGGNESKEEGPKSPPRPLRHTLYIQMQLCSEKSLQDFLMNPQARRAPAGPEKGVLDGHGSKVDIPYALSLFGQIVHGVKHVHAQGLIHRDLKPSNCFMDGNNVIKVGDFGLSRSSTAAEDESLAPMSIDSSARGRGAGMDNTAGVGTRSYASPEQMNGSDYDASTDVYSLGIMLFEMCYPMSTGMERHIVFTNLRKRVFPEEWMEDTAQQFPILHDMLVQMLSTDPSQRPSSADIAAQMDRILSEFTVLSIDKVHSERGATLLRVEADAIDGILATTIGLIRETAPSVKIEQYGLRGGGTSDYSSGSSTTAIMEFALTTSTTVAENGEGKQATQGASLKNILHSMKRHKNIKMARQISNSWHTN